MALRDTVSLSSGGVVEPSKQRLDAHLAEWVQTQRLSPSTLASYRRNTRLHIAILTSVLSRLPGSKVDAWMRKLEASGRADGQADLSARTVRYVFTIVRSALGDAVEQGRLAVSPTDRSPRARPRPPGDAGLDRAGARPVPQPGGRPGSGPRHGLTAAGGHRDAPR
jgi:site-specific recombinase XerC